LQNKAQALFCLDTLHVPHTCNKTMKNEQTSSTGSALFMTV